MSRPDFVISDVAMRRELAIKDVPMRSIVLDVGCVLDKHYERVASLDEYEVELDLLLDEVLMFIGDSQLAETGIEALQEEIINQHERERSDEGKIVADLAKDLAHELLDRCVEHGLYLADGRLPYEFGGFVNGDGVFIIKTIHENN